MGKNCSDCLPCKQGLPCGGAKGVHGMVGMQGYGGIRRITNWGGSYGLSTEGETQIDAWMAADSEDWPKLITLIEETYLAEPSQAELLATSLLGAAPDSEVDVLAAWTVVCNTIMNLDEFLTKR